MNGRCKAGGLIIELFKTMRSSMKFDRMIPSGSSWLMGIKVQRVVDQAHAVIEPGKKISMWKFNQITGRTRDHLLRPTAKYMKIEITGKLPPCEICAQAKIRQANVPKKKMKQVPSRPGHRVFIDISYFQHESMGGKRHRLIAMDEFSDCSHRFFLKRKSDQIVMIQMWIKALINKYQVSAHPKYRILYIFEPIYLTNKWFWAILKNTIVFFRKFCISRGTSIRISFLQCLYSVKLVVKIDF